MKLKCFGCSWGPVAKVLRCLWVGVSGVGGCFDFYPPAALSTHVPHDLHVQPPSLCFLVPKCLNQLHLSTFALHFPPLLILILCFVCFLMYIATFPWQLPQPPIFLMSMKMGEIFLQNPQTFSHRCPNEECLKWPAFVWILTTSPTTYSYGSSMPWINSDWYMMYQNSLPIDIPGTLWWPGCFAWNLGQPFWGRVEFPKMEDVQFNRFQVLLEV